MCIQTYVQNLLLTYFRIFWRGLLLNIWICFIDCVHTTQKTGIWTDEIHSSIGKLVYRQVTEVTEIHLKQPISGSFQGCRLLRALVCTRLNKPIQPFTVAAASRVYIPLRWNLGFYTSRGNCSDWTRCNSTSNFPFLFLSVALQISIRTTSPPISHVQSWQWER